MEYKIGEIFNCDGEWYQCIRSSDCPNCDLKSIQYCRHKFPCESLQRTDCEEVIFKKLEKVGEPFERNGYMYQEYKAHTYPLLMSGGAKIPTDNGFAVIIKQNKENMEEGNNTKHSNTENIGKNLKPFDLQAAKSGKPVCTRDGRKARIICFDLRNSDAICMIAAIECGKTETVFYYYLDGKCCGEGNNKYDLIMISEKKEGWVNVYKEPEGEYYVDKLIHKTEKFAFDVACPDNYIGTVKIEWYE